MLYRRILAAHIVGAALLSLTGCARPSAHSVAVQAPNAVVTSTAEAEPLLSGSQLSAAFSYGMGSIRFDPPKDSAVAKMSSTDAMEAFAQTGLYTSEVSGLTPEVFLASFTSYQRSTKVDPTTGALVPSTSDELVWVIRYKGVEDIAAGAGGNGSRGASMASAPPGAVAVIHDVIAIVDADTGVVQQVVSALPDAEAAGPPTGAPKKPSA